MQDRLINRSRPHVTIIKAYVTIIGKCNAGKLNSEGAVATLGLLPPQKTVHLAADDKRLVLRPVIINSGNALLLQLTAMVLKRVQQGTYNYVLSVGFHFLVPPIQRRLRRYWPHDLFVRF
jgi:hypothetical protein